MLLRLPFFVNDKYVTSEKLQIFQLCIPIDNSSTLKYMALV